MDECGMLLLLRRCKACSQYTHQKEEEKILPRDQLSMPNSDAPVRAGRGRGDRERSAYTDFARMITNSTWDMPYRNNTEELECVTTASGNNLGGKDMCVLWTWRYTISVGNVGVSVAYSIYQDSGRAILFAWSYVVPVDTSDFSSRGDQIFLPMPWKSVFAISLLRISRSKQRKSL